MKTFAETHWTQAEGIDLCRRIEAIAPYVGAHIGLTGGLLYKEGLRKDLDIVVYRIRQAATVERTQFFSMLRAIDITVLKDTGFVVKAEQNGRGIDFLFPDYESDGDYIVEEVQS